MRWYIEAFKKYAVFNGRARRKEFWMFALVEIVAIAALRIVETTAGTSIPYVVYGVATFMPAVAVAVRRLHGVGKSGWSLLLGFIPVVGGIIVLVFLCTEGERGQNQHGLDPKLTERFPYAPLPQG
ncbi:MULTISPECIES: DUF805 domain-containing protein [unclassified Streptomyces]|uniref:DUF805 domain-containing protein n=1 Tax=unclassified Streptomyces TaxID=2593676 RepID=UPI002E2A8EA6|nr:DUF805 domain-containing protein [Streptomyces sp. NBC_00223]